MPLLEPISIQNATIFIWKITENLENLQENISLKSFDIEKIAKLKKIEAIKCFWASRQLLQKTHLYDVFFYFEEKKPMLSNGNFISVSHSFPFVIIGVSNEKIGIDIEKISIRCAKLAPKFTEWKPINSLSEGEIAREYTKIWTLKEALFKIISDRGVDFKKHLLINNFQENQNEFLLSVNHFQQKENYLGLSFFLEDFIWSVAIKK